MRPDIMVVGEVRGEEAYALFQAISTGHGGLATLHAEDASSAIQRLTSKPMDVAPSYISFLDLIFSVRRVAIPNSGNPGSPRIVRRVISVEEVESANKIIQSFAWEPGKDKFHDYLENSAKLKKTCEGLWQIHEIDYSRDPEQNIGLAMAPFKEHQEFHRNQHRVFPVPQRSGRNDSENQSRFSFEAFIPN